MQTTRPSVKAWRGLNTVTDPLRLDLSWLIQADNVDVTQTGALVRSKGYAKSVSGTAITGAYATKDLQRMYVVDNGTLKRVNADLTTTTLVTGLSSATMRFTEVNGVVYYANGTDYGRLEDRGADRWGIVPPGGVTLARGSGNLPAGTYSVCCTLQAPDGLESGNGDAAVITVEDNSQIVVSGITQRAGYTTNVYVTMRDGAVFYQLQSSAGAAVSYNCDPNDLGVELPWWLMAGPRGSIPCCWAGRMYVAETMPQDDVSVIWRSEPLAFHHFDYGSEGLMVPGEVRMLAACDEALLIGTDRGIYAYNGEALALLAPYGVVAGVHAAEFRGRVLFWSLRGLCQAMPFANLTGDTASVAPGAAAAGTVVEWDGNRRYVVALQKGGTAYNTRT